MAHYAFLNSDNIVVEVIVGIDENELIEGRKPEEWYAQFRGMTCVRTSYNNRIRKQFAGVGFSYDPSSDVFISPKPYSSWTLDGNYDWQPPVPMPSDGKHYWNEETQQWVPA